MKLFTLSRGRSKARMKPWMIDSKKKCENYRDALNGSDTRKMFYSIEPAPNGSKVWRKQRSTIGGNQPSAVPRINRHGDTSVNGYVSKHGFQAHT